MKDVIHLKKGQVVKITKDMIIGDVIAAYPESADVMFESGFHCVGCHGAAFESIEEGCLIHRLDPDELCKKINDHLKKTRAKIRRNPVHKTNRAR